MNHMQVKTWIYSVARHRSQQDWKHHRQVDVPDVLANEIAYKFTWKKNLVAWLDGRELVEGKNPDGWYRITGKAAASEAYTFVIDRLVVPGSHQRRIDEEPAVDPVPHPRGGASDENVATPLSLGRGVSHSSKSQDSKLILYGWIVVVALLLAIALTGW